MNTTLLMFEIWRNSERYAIIASIAVFALLVIVLCFRILSRKKAFIVKTQKKSIMKFGSDSYKQEILIRMEYNRRNDLIRLFDIINDIRENIDTCLSDLNNQNKISILEIDHKIADTQERICDYWNTSVKRRNFYMSIAIHYASFILANTIWQEQKAIRGILIEIRNQMEQVARQIDIVYRQMEKDYDRSDIELKQKHKRLCQKHKRLCNLKNFFGRRNMKYRSLLERQNETTEIYREYIRDHYGSRGRAWAERIERRNADCISVN